MSTQETITIMIQKYERKITKIEETITFEIPADLKYYIGKVSCYQEFISDLKQLQQNTGD